MSQALFNARRGLTQVSGLLKQGKVLPAVQHVQSALKIITSSTILRSELDEFRRLIKDACMYLDNNADLRKVFPLAIEFSEGKEDELAEALTELTSMLEAETTKSISLALEEKAQKKITALEKGQSHLNAGEHDHARKIFSQITKEFAGDADLATNIGDRFLQNGLYEDATQYFEESAKINPASANVFNRLGITLRKMKRFDVAEQHFIKALEIEKHDPNLHFNLGRLYLDWKKWEKTIEHAAKALHLDPNFIEAQQLANYAKRMMNEGQG